MRIYGVILVFLLILGSGPAEAKIYTFKDKDGKVIYVNRISAIPGQYRDQVDGASPALSTKPVNRTLRQQNPRPTRTQPARPSSSTQSRDSKARANKQSVEIYVTSWCTYCKKLESFLKSNNISYTKYDVEKSSKGKKEYARLGSSGVPITKVGSQVIRGFNPQAILAVVEK